MFCKDPVARRCPVYLKFLDVTPAEALPISVKLAGVEYPAGFTNWAVVGAGSGEGIRMIY